MWRDFLPLICRRGEPHGNDRQPCQSVVAAGRIASQAREGHFLALPSSEKRIPRFSIQLASPDDRMQNPDSHRPAELRGFVDALQLPATSRQSHQRHTSPPVVEAE